MTETKLLPLLTWRQAVARSSLPATSKLVALALSLYMNEMGGSAFPGVALLMSNTSLSERAVRGHLRELVAEGWLVLVERGGIKGVQKRANSYQAVIPNPGTSCQEPESAPLHVVPPTPAPAASDPCTSCTPSLQELSTNSGNLTKTSGQPTKVRSHSPGEDFTPNDTHVEYARSHGLSVDDELGHWLDWCAANGRKYVNVNKGFSTWLRQAVKFGGGGHPVATIEDLAEPRSVVGMYECRLGLGCENGWVPDTSPAVRCECQR